MPKKKAHTIKHLRSTPGTEVAMCGARMPDGGSLLHFATTSRLATCAPCKVKSSAVRRDFMARYQLARAAYMRAQYARTKGE
jgi:hypothetical protein